MKNALTFTLYILITLGIAIYSVSKADYNWDVLPYAGCVLSFESSDMNVIHKSAYELFKTSVDEKTYLLQTSGNKYRETMAECAECFNQTLPFYKLKLLYTVLIYALYKSGVNLFIAPFVIQAIFYFLTCLVVYLWIWKITANAIYSFLLSVLLAVSPYFLINLSNAAPDMLACFLILLAVYCLLENKINLFLLVMVLCVAARGDNIFLFTVLSGIILSSNQFKASSKRIYIGISAGVIVLIFLNVWSGSYGYSTLFYHSFVERLTKPAEFNSVINPSMYIKGLLNWVFFFKYSTVALQLIFLSVVIYIKLHSRADIKNDLEFLILIAMGLSIIIHYILYPVMDDRYFMAQYLVIDILFIKSVYEHLVNHKRLQYPK